MGTRRFGDVVILILDRKSGFASQAHFTFRMVPGREPETIQLHIFVFNLRLLNPHGRILAGFTFDSYDGKIVCVDPDFSVIKELIPFSGQQIEDVFSATRRRIVTRQGKLIIFGVQGRLPLVLIVQKFLLALQQPFKNMIDQERRTGLGDHLELLDVGSAVGDVHHHLGLVISGEAMIVHVIDALAAELL